MRSDFLALFFFFDLVDELQLGGRRASAAATSCATPCCMWCFSMPSHLYELLPIAVLIGTIFVMARLAQSSEFTIMRTSGMGPWRALRTLLVLGAGCFVVLTFAVGDYAAPVADKTAQLLKVALPGPDHSRDSHRGMAEGASAIQHSYAVNVRALTARWRHAERADLRVRQPWFPRLADRGHPGPVWRRRRLAARRRARAANSQRSSTGAEGGTRAVTQLQLAHAASAPTWWPPRLAQARPHGARWTFSTYIRHLNANGQSAQRYEIEFWRKVFYPLSCLVMVVLALPFAYLHFRSGGIAGYVFGGVMAGISFFPAQQRVRLRIGNAAATGRHGSRRRRRADLHRVAVTGCLQLAGAAALAA